VTQLGARLGYFAFELMIAYHPLLEEQASQQAGV
jgi:hypothetical protein